MSKSWQAYAHQIIPALSPCIQAMLALDGKPLI